MSIQVEMFEKDQIIAAIYKTSFELFKGGIERCEGALFLYGQHYGIAIYFEKGFLYIDGTPSWAYDHDKDERLSELLRERFYLKSLFDKLKIGNRLYRQFLDDEAFEKYEKYE
tara:strand:- start:149 stop:487 length:339 start_codon:yes stop_codon:yes gene_type:complete